MSWLKHHYGSTEGPLGVPMTDKQAFALEDVLKTLPRDGGDYDYKKAVVAKAPTEVMAGERTDVSWISEESVDRDREVVLARGMDDSHFKLNPLVTIQHSYHLPPVGKSLWRKRVKDGSLSGIKAKTHYPPRPQDWPGEDWEPDYAFSLVQAELLRGKSIGFLVKKAHAPTPDEIRSHPEWAEARRVIDEWLLLEYACCFLPVQPNALVEQVSKSIPNHFLTEAGIALPALRPLPHLEVEEIEKAVQRHLHKLDLNHIATTVVNECIDLRRGRI